MGSHEEYAHQLFKNGQFSDCVIRCQHRSWHLHRAILSQRCDFFRACLLHEFKEATPAPDGNTTEVSMQEDDPDALHRTLKWLYTLQYPHLDEQHRTAVPECDQDEMLPVEFWTSELALLIVADKYNLNDLAGQACKSICDATAHHLKDVPANDIHNSASIQFEDFLSMLDSIYLDPATTSKTIEELKIPLLQNTAMTLATSATSQSRIADLMTAAPEFAMDLVQALRQNVSVQCASGRETKDDVGVVGERKSSYSFGSIRSRSDYASSSDSDISQRSRRRSRNRNSPPAKAYIPMNEDSDLD